MLRQFTWTMAAVILAISVSSGRANTVELNVMSFNVWSAEDGAAGRQRIINTIEQAGADLIGFQEMGASALRSIATSMGYYYYDQGMGSEAIMSRYRIVAFAPRRYGVLVELAPGHEAWVFNTHLYHAPYGPYQLNGIAYNGGKLYDPSLPASITQVVADQVRARGGEINTLLKSAADAGALSSGQPVFVTGDFNEPSHLDWTADAVAAGVHVAEVPWPTSLAVVAQGLRDSWRDVYPSVATDPGRTWSPVYPSTYMNAGDGTVPQPRPVPEPQDRIDLVYYAGGSVEALTSRRSGPIGGNVTEEWEIANYPSDHNAVTSTFRISGLDETQLTFRALGTNGSEVPQGYGSRVLSSPEIVVDFSAQGGAVGETAAWRYIDDALWPAGVAQLDSGNGEPADGSATFRVLLTPDAGAAARIDAFALLDRADGNGLGQTVRWELWGRDLLLADGSALVPDDGQFQVVTGLDTPWAEPLELRLTHLAGVNNGLALDNLVFRQFLVPEPTSLGWFLLLLPFWMRRR